MMAPNVMTVMYPLAPTPLRMRAVSQCEFNNALATLQLLVQVDERAPQTHATEYPYLSRGATSIRATAIQ
jgi:hypothetical protein